jgi:arylsulfatase
MKMKSIALSGAVLAFTGWESKAKETFEEQGKERPNILFITTDYQAGADIPFETEALHMPHLNQLTEEGVVFRNHYCTAPISMPSRYTIISGTYPHYHGMIDNMGQWLPDNTPTLMEELGKVGYHTVGIGKMHFHPWDREAGFDKWISAERKGNTAADTNRRDDYYYHLKNAGLNRWDYLKRQSQAEIYGVYHWPFADSLHIDAFVGDRAARYFEKDQTEGPWFMWLSFNGPHNPWDPPKNYTEPYLDKNLLDAVNHVEGELQQHPLDITTLRYSYTRQVSDYLDQFPEKWNESINRILAGHYGGLSFIDHQLGKVLQAMEKRGQLENTIIIFTSDHGAHLGDHNLIHKGTPYERSARVPFVVWWPDKIEPGVREGFSSHVDLMPTLLDLARADKVPEIMQGKSLVDMMLGAEEGDDHAIIEILGNYSWITKDYLLGVFPTTKEEILIDRREDPGEHFNLINNPEYIHIADSLRQLLFEHHPPIKEAFQKGEELEELPRMLIFSQGETTHRRNTPYLGGKGWTLKTAFTWTEGDSGSIFTFQEGRAHGLTAYVQNGTLYFGLRKWGEDQILKISDKLVEGKINCEASLCKDGMLTVTINGKPAFSGKTNWPMPIQAGRTHALTGSWFAGSGGFNWIKPIGNNQQTEEYSGSIDVVEIQIK